MSLHQALVRALSAPSTSDLWALRAEMLEAGLPEDSRAYRIVDHFRSYLDELATGTSSREYSELASKLDIGAVGGVVLERVLEPGGSEELALGVLSGLLSEGLMILATRQHVHAWEGELGAVHRRAAWYLYEELWRWSEERQPEVEAVERRRLLDQLLAPTHAKEENGYARALLLGLLFQVLLIGELSGNDHDGGD